jgi:hypothetical protein
MGTSIFGQNQSCRIKGIQRSDQGSQIALVLDLITADQQWEADLGEAI